MSTWVITLDTTAPQITWGAVDGAVGGEELTVFYTVDEPGVVSATATLRDGRVLPMTVLADRFTVELPDDTPDGNVTVSVLLRDDVLNSRTSTLPVYVAGVIGPEPPPYVPPTGLPSPPERTRHMVDMGRTRGRLRSSYEQTAVLTSTTHARVRSRYIVPRPRHRSIYESLTVTSVYGVLGRVSTRSGGKLAETYTVRKRPEGPGTEDELILLDLL